MARVVLARDRELDREVAIKWILPDLQGHVSAPQRFRNEARFLGAVEHPNLLRVYGCVEATDGSVGLVMEYVQGRDLEREMASAGRLDPETVRAVGLQVAGALEALHAAKIFHRDLKPANLMRREQDGSVVVMDLGLARSSEVTRMTQTGYLVGTLLYMAPEVLEGSPYAASADVYQLGATLWELLTGEAMISRGRPGQLDETIRAILDGKRASVATPPPGVPEDLWAAIEVAVRVDPAHRPPSAAAFAQVLRGDRPVDAFPAPASLASGTVFPRTGMTGAGLPRTRSRTLAIALGAACLLGATGAFLTRWWSPGPPQDVRWRVVGRAVVVDMAPGGPEDLRVELDGELHGARFELSGGRRRAVIPGIAPGKDHALRLVWADGLGPLQVLQGEPDAVGDLELGGSALLQVHARRPCQVGFGKPGDRLWALTPGHHPLPAPSRSSPDFRLRWEEDGVPRHRSITWVDLFTREARRVADQFSSLDIHATLLQASIDRVSTSYAAERDRWRLALPWLPEVLGHSGVPVPLRRRLHRVFQAWERSVDEESYLGGSPRRLALPATSLGGRFALDVNVDEGDPPVPAPVAGRPVELDEPDCEPHPENPDVYTVVTAFTKTVPFGQYSSACEVLSWTWPDLQAAPDEPVRLWLRTARLPSRAVIRLTAAGSGNNTGTNTETTAQEDLLVDLWRPGAIEEQKGFRGWLGITLPADLWPRPGTRTSLRVVDLLRPQATMARIWRIRLDRPGRN